MADTLLGAFLVLDGHTRLAAALEEGIDPRCLALFATCEVRGSTPHQRSAVAALESLLVQEDRRVASYESIKLPPAHPTAAAASRNVTQR